MPSGCFKKSACIRRSALVEIVKMEDRDEKIRVMKHCDEAFPIRLFDRPDCDAIVYRITTYALFYAAYDRIRGGVLPCRICGLLCQ